MLQASMNRQPRKPTIFVDDTVLPSEIVELKQLGEVKVVLHQTDKVDWTLYNMLDVDVLLSYVLTTEEVVDQSYKHGMHVHNAVVTRYWDTFTAVLRQSAERGWVGVSNNLSAHALLFDPIELVVQQIKEECNNV